MKTSRIASIVPLFLALACSRLSAQTVGSSTQPVIVDQGPHHNLWQYQTYEPGQNGKPVAKIHQYRELASCLNYLNASGKWEAAQEKISAFSGGAVAQLGQNIIIFANNINTPGAIDAQMSDGLRLRSHVLGLIYVDSSTGESVLIGQLQDSEGVLVADNQVLYPNAFAGIRADISYTYHKSGLEQDIVLREQIPTPESVGLHSATTELEVVTEFVEPPAARVGTPIADGAESDQTVSWGATSLGLGKAFNLNGQDAPVRVYKQYTTIGGRYFLIEKVRVQDIQPGLSKLPDQASNAKRLPGMASTHFTFPKAPVAKSAARPMHLAMGKQPDNGYVLDYVSLSTAYTNYTFQSDTTYFVSGALNLSGSNVFEGGTIIKYAVNGSINVSFPNAINFLSAQYHPIVFTAKDDNTVGAAISGSTGTPFGYYANPALAINGAYVNGMSISHFRIADAKVGLQVQYSLVNVSDAQFVQSDTAVKPMTSTVNVINGLFYNVNTNFWFQYGSVYANQCTFGNANYIMGPGSTGGAIFSTNSIYVDETNSSGVSGGYNGFYNAPVFGSTTWSNSFYPFQRVGAANCYLLTNGAFFKCGTHLTNTLAQISVGTTHPPIVYSNLTFSIATNFCQQAQRDTNYNPDLGYHYDPLDYVFSGVNVYSNITFTAGTAVGWFELPSSGGTGCGFSIYDKVVLAFNGNASSPCTFARYCTVQEGGNGLWSNLGYMGGIVSGSLSGGYSMNPINAPLISLNFTRCALMAEGPNQFRESTSGGLSQVVAQNSEIWDGNVGAYWDNL